MTFNDRIVSEYLFGKDVEKLSQITYMVDVQSKHSYLIY